MPWLELMQILFCFSLVTVFISGSAAWRAEAGKVNLIVYASPCVREGSLLGAELIHAHREDNVLTDPEMHAQIVLHMPEAQSTCMQRSVGRLSLQIAVSW